MWSAGSVLKSSCGLLDIKGWSTPTLNYFKNQFCPEKCKGFLFLLDQCVIHAKYLLLFAWRRECCKKCCVLSLKQRKKLILSWRKYCVTYSEVTVPLHSCNGFIRSQQQFWQFKSNERTVVWRLQEKGIWHTPSLPDPTLRLPTVLHHVLPSPPSPPSLLVYLQQHMQEDPGFLKSVLAVGVSAHC